MYTFTSYLLGYRWLSNDTNMDLDFDINKKYRRPKDHTVKQNSLI